MNYASRLLLACNSDVDGFSVPESESRNCAALFFRRPSTYRDLQRSIRRDSENVSQLRFDFRRVPCNFSRGVERSISGAEEKSLLHLAWPKAIIISSIA